MGAAKLRWLLIEWTTTQFHEVPARESNKSPG